jgi:dihydroorotate dehydrogenase electron transfer subunit
MEQAWYGELDGMVPSARQLVAPVLAQRSLARDTWLVELECPEIAQQIVPGQFFMVRPAVGTDSLLARPFALYDVVRQAGQPIGVSFGFTVVGKLTGLMAGWQPGDMAEIWGPLGNGFPVPGRGHLMCVAGGIGQTPFVAVTREALRHSQYGQPLRAVAEAPQKVSVCYGVRSEAYLAGVDDFTLPGLDLRLATDDGSLGHHGFVTQLLQQSVDAGDRPDQVYCCGPQPMMRSVADICQTTGIDCWLSLETPMACGFGACFSCVTRVRIGEDEWDYRRTCVEGPVFRSDQLQL